MANLITALLQEIEKTYVTKQTIRDKKMRRRIDKTIEIVNDHHEIANLIIKGNPFHSHHARSVHAAAGDLEVPQTVKEEENEGDSMTESDLSSGSIMDDNEEEDTMSQKISKVNESDMTV